MTKRTSSIQLLCTLTLVSLSIFMQNHVYAQAGSLPTSITTSTAANTSSNRLNKPTVTGTLSETNYTVSLSMPNNSGNGTSFTVNTQGVTGAGLTQFNANYNNTTISSTALKGYYITSSSTQPFLTGNNTSANRLKITGTSAPSSGIINSQWLFNDIATTPAASVASPLQQQGVGGTSMTNQSVQVTFFNPGVYYVWAYVTNTNFFYFSEYPLVLTVYPINFSTNPDGSEKTYCNLNNPTFSSIPYDRKTAQGFPYSYRYFYKDPSGQLVEAQGSSPLSVVYDANGIPFDNYFYVARGYTPVTNGPTYWQNIDLNDASTLTPIPWTEVPALVIDTVTPSSLLFNSEESPVSQVSWTLNGDGSYLYAFVVNGTVFSATSVNSYTSPTSPATPDYSFDPVLQVPTTHTLGTETSLDPGNVLPLIDLVPTGESRNLYYVGYAGCYATDNTQFVTSTIPMHNYANPPVATSPASWCINTGDSKTVEDLYNKLSATLTFDTQYDLVWFDETNDPSHSTELLLTDALTDGNTYRVYYRLPLETIKSSSYTEVVVHLNENPTVTAPADQAVCIGSPVTLSGEGATSYVWNHSVSNGVAFTVSATQTYTVTGTDANGCTNTATTTVTANALPTVTAPANQTVCTGSMVTLSGGGATSYEWNNGIENGVEFAANATQTYTVTGTDVNGCSNTASTTVTTSSNYFTGGAGALPGIGYDLSDAANWLCGVPSTPTIPPGYTVYIDGSYDFENLIIECGGSVVIRETGRVNITNQLTNGGLVKVMNGGTIKYGTQVTGTCATPPNNQYVQNLASHRYWYIGAATNNAERSNFGELATVGVSNTGTQMWSWKENLNAPSAQGGYTTPEYKSLNGHQYLKPGMGYVLYNYSNYNPSTPQNIVTNGLFNDSTFTISGLTRTAAGVGVNLYGYHLLANPYPSFLDAEKFFDASSNLVPTLWYRTTAQSSPVSAMTFNTYNVAAGVSVDGTGGNTSPWYSATVNAVTSNSDSVARFIPPMQGFWVRVASTAGGSATFKSSEMSVYNPENYGTLRSGSNGLSSLVKLSVQFGDQRDQIAVGLGASAQNAFDNYDSEKMFTSGYVQMYTVSSNKKLAINSLKNNKSKTSVPLTIECPSNGWYAINADQVAMENGTVLLEDKLNTTFYDLTLVPSVSFFANSGVLSNRFVLHFVKPIQIANPVGPSSIDDLVGETIQSEIIVNATSTGKVVVNLNNVDDNTSSTVRVIDLNGRVIDSFVSGGVEFNFQLNCGQGSYIIEVTNGLTSEKKKVFIQ